MSRSPSGPSAPAAIERLRETVAGLPEVVEKIDKFGHVAFRVRDKPFVMIGNGTWYRLAAPASLVQALDEDAESSARDGPPR